MRSIALVALVIVSACTEAPETLTLTVRGTPATAVALVVVRDGPSADWQPAKKAPLGAYTITVSHPFTVAAVCLESSPGVPDTWHTYEYAYSLQDPVKDGILVCAELANSAPQPIVGTMVQAGQVQFGKAAVRSDTPNWQISTLTPVFPDMDIIANSKDHLQIIRGIDLTAHALPTIDVEANGVALLPLAVTSDATSSETVEARVAVRTPSFVSEPAPIYAGPLDGVLVAPSGGLAELDEQVVTVDASTGTQHRIANVEFTAGDSLAFQLPDPIVHGAWQPLATDVTATPAKPDAPTRVTWTLLPYGDDGDVEMQLEGMASDPTSPTTAAAYHLRVTPAYMNDAVYSSLELTTQLPGFDAKWRIDPTKPYTRTFRAIAPSGRRPNETRLVEEITPAPTP
jgi:hypothetical protein